MDYEKAYKEALETARKLNNGEGVEAPSGWTVCEVIFPELRESDDERIRKELISFVTNDGWKFTKLTKEEKESWIAWLEKQGEQPKKVSIWKHWKDGIAGNGDGEQIYLIKVGNIYDISSCLDCECDYIELSELNKLMLENQNKQKPTWSEEDEKIMKEIAEFIYISTFKPKDIKKKEKWLTWLEKQGQTFPILSNSSNTGKKWTEATMTEKERKAFEAALRTAWKKYCDGARLVDQFEDNYIECAFSKGFFQGYIAADEIRKIVNAETSAK